MVRVCLFAVLHVKLYNVIFLYRFEWKLKHADSDLLMVYPDTGIIQPNETQVSPSKGCAAYYFTYNVNWFNFLCGGWTAYLIDPDSFAGWSFYILIGPPKSDRLKGSGQTKYGTIPSFFLLTFLFLLV